MYLDTSKIIEQTCSHVSGECRDLLKKMTLNNPETRPSPEECLQHPWFAKDRAQLQNLLIINKQSNFIRKDQSYCSYKSNPGVDATSFFMAPSFYECLELIS